MFRSLFLRASGWGMPRNARRVSLTRFSSAMRSKTAPRSPGWMSREPRPPETEITRGIAAPSIVASARADFSSRVSGVSAAAGSDGHSTDLAALVAESVDDSESRIRHGPHRDHDVVGALRSVGVDETVVAAGQGLPLGHRPLGDVGQLVVPGTLPDATLHVGVLVLGDADHQRDLGIEHVTNGRARVAYEALEELILGQVDVLDRMGSEKTVLAHEPRRLAVFGDTSGDGGQVCRFLAVAGEEDAPAAVGDAHHVVVTGMDV